MTTQVRRRADMENTAFVTDEEIQQYIQDSYGELYDLIIESNPTFYQATSGTITTVEGTDTYTVPETVETDANMYKVVGVDVQFNGVWRSIRPFRSYQLNVLNDQTSWADRYSVFYQMVGPKRQVGAAISDADQRQIRFIPSPPSGQSARVHYIPYPDNLAAGSIDFQSFTGWDEYIICDAAAKCLEKEESHEAADRLLARKMAAAARIRYQAQTMNDDDPGSVRDSSGDFQSYWGWNWEF